MELDKDKNQLPIDLFKKLKKVWYNNEREKTIIDASCDLIRGGGNEVSPLALFGVTFNLLTKSMESLRNGFNIDDEQDVLPVDRVRATINILDIVSPFVQPNMIVSFINDILSICFTVLSNDSPTQILIPCINFVKTVFVATPPALFSESELVKNVFNEVLVLVVEGSPKVRKRAMFCIVGVFKASQKAPIVSEHVTNYSLSIFQQCRPQSTVATLYILELLKNIVGNIPKKFQKILCESILVLPDYGQVILTCKALLFFKNLFLHTEKYSPLVIQLIRALIDNKSLRTIVDPDSIMAFSDTLCVAFNVLSKSHPELVMENITLLIDRIFVFLEYENKMANTNICRYLGDSLQVCMSSEIILENDENSKLILIAEKIKNGLNYTYNHSWKAIIKLTSALFKSVVPFSTPNNRNFFKNVFKGIIDDLLVIRSQKFFIIVINNSLGDAVSALGISQFLEAVPLLFPTIDYDPAETVIVDNLWLLPLLRTYLQNSELSVFIKYFLPIVDQLTSNQEIASRQDSLIISSQLNILILQIWNIFPNFCTNPTDIGNFKQIAKKLCDIIISTETDISKDVVQGIHKLILTNTGDIEEVSKFAKNFLPNLFNKFLSELKRTERQLVYNSIDGFLSIADSTLVNRLFTEVSKRLLKETMGGNDFIKTEKLLDLLSCFIPYITMENVELLYKSTEPLFQSKDQFVQKRAFKVLYKMCDVHPVLVDGNLEQMIQILSDTVSKSKTSKVIRMQLIDLVINSTDDFTIRTNILKIFILEIVLFIKDINKKTRDLSVNILTRQAKFFQENGQGTQLMYLLLALLTFDTPVIPSTLLAMEHIIREAKMDRSIMPDLISTATTLLESPSNEIMSNALGLLKVLVRKCDLDFLKENLGNILKTLMTFGTIKLRFKHTNEIKLILVKIMRRVDPKEVVNQTAPKYKKFVNNVRKTESRNQRDIKASRKTKTKKDDADEEMKLETYETDLMNVDGGAVQKQGLWIVENQTDDEVLDFLSSDATKHIVSSIPGLEAKNRKRKLSEMSDTIQYDEFGRMIVEESDEDEHQMIEEERFSKRPRFTVKKKDYVNERDKELTGKHSGVSFKAKKGKGDVKKKDKLEPYAYIPLDPAQLNKRRRHVAHKKYNHVANTKSGKRKSNK